MQTHNHKATRSSKEVARGLIAPALLPEMTRAEV